MLSKRKRSGDGWVRRRLFATCKFFAFSFYFKSNPLNSLSISFAVNWNRTKMTEKEVKHSFRFSSFSSSILNPFRFFVISISFHFLSSSVRSNENDKFCFLQNVFLFYFETSNWMLFQFRSHWMRPKGRKIDKNCSLSSIWLKFGFFCSIIIHARTSLVCTRTHFRLSILFFTSFSRFPSFFFHLSIVFCRSLSLT